MRTWVEALKSQDRETPEIWDTKTNLMKETYLDQKMLKLEIDYQLYKLLTPFRLKVTRDKLIYVIQEEILEKRTILW